MKRLGFGIAFVAAWIGFSAAALAVACGSGGANDPKCVFTCDTACISGLQLCTTGTVYCPYPQGCPPDVACFCYDYFRSCTTNTPTVQCPPGTYGCNHNSQPGYCCPVQLSPTTKPPSGCVPSCPSSYCGTVSNGCGGWCTCNYCSSSCIPACGQIGDCGVQCPNTANGAPLAPTTVGPGSTASPGPLLGTNTPLLKWTKVAKADNYRVWVYGSGGTVAWNNLSVTTTQVTTAILDAGSYYWRVRADNTTCGTLLQSPWSEYRYFRIPALPSVTNLVLKNVNNNVVVPWETGDRAHICMDQFVTSNTPRSAKFEVQASDGVGSRNITSIVLNWNGTNYPMTVGVTGAAIGTTASATIAFAPGDNTSGDMPITITITNSTGNTSTLEGYSWKVWDCQVPVGGTIYSDVDSNAQCLTGTGFSTPAPAGLNFKTAIFTKQPSGPAITLNAVSASSYTSGNLQWNNSYLLTANSDISGAVSQYRFINLDTGNTVCNQLVNVKTEIDPYAASPQLQADMSIVQGQDHWYQAVGGGIQSAAQIVNMIPTSCVQSPSCKAAMSKQTAEGGDNGLISSAVVANNSGCTLGSGGLDCLYSYPSNFHTARSTLSAADKIGYQFLYDKYYTALGKGIYRSGNTAMSQLGAGITGVVLVNGNLTVDINNTPAGNGFLLVAASGDITFNNNVTSATGIFVADDDIFTTGQNSTALTINGVLYGSKSVSDIRFQRDFVNPVDNNTAAATLVVYKPDLIFSMPGDLQKLLSGWTEY